MPPGQHPLRRAASGRETLSGCYRCTDADGTERRVEVSARPLPEGRAGAVFRDITVQHAASVEAQAASARQAILTALCRRLNAADTAEAIAEIVTEETRSLLQLPAVQVKLFLLDRAADTLVCLASAPDLRPKRPRSAAEAQPVTLRFDVQAPELWQLYVARRPSAESLPLIAGGAALGHLSVASSAGDVWADPAARETLETIAAVAALALAGSAASGQAAAASAQADALREIAAFAGSGRTLEEGADFAGAAIQRVTRAAVCTVSVPKNGTLCVLGQAYRDALLFSQTEPRDPRLHGKAIRKAERTQKTTVQLGLVQGKDTGPWRVFTGSSAVYSVIALPLAKRGVLAVYTQGDQALPDGQKKFLEAVAALLALSSAATAPADGAD